MPECNPWSRCCSLQLCLRSKNESCWRLQSDEEMEMKKNGVQRRIDCGGGDKHTVLERNWKLLRGTVWIMSVRQARLTTSAPQCVLRLMNFFDAHLLKWTRGRKLQFEILELWDQLLGSHLSRVQRKHRNLLTSNFVREGWGWKVWLKRFNRLSIAQISPLLYLSKICNSKLFFHNTIYMAPTMC